MRLLTLLAAGASLLGVAAAIPEAYSEAYVDAADMDVVGRLGKRALINNLEPRDELCNGTIHLDPTTQTYPIASGDTLTAIGARFNRGICDIATANNISNVDYIVAGASLTIPPQVCFPDSTSCIKPPPTANCINGGPGFYIVQSGDTLGQLSFAYNITLAALEGANKANVPNPDLIKIGDVLNVPICENSSADLTPYKIKAGDTFYILGHRYRSSAGAIRAVNPGVNPNALQIDQVITLVSFAHKFPGTEPVDEL